jgi:hypothetical protein
MEQWKDVKGYEGIYQVSNEGRVKSIGYSKERILKPINLNGYLIVNLYKDKINKQYYIHRLVCLNFLDNPENKKEVNHINGLKTNNRLENLEWVTPKENTIHAVDTGLKDDRGSKHSKSKLTEKEVLEIRSSNLTLKELGKNYEVSFSIISRIKRRKMWKHI